MKLLARWKSWIDTSDAILAHWLRAANEALLGEMPVLAAGTALYGIIAAVPVMAAAVSIYSLVADPTLIESHMRPLARVLPPGVVGFLQEQLQRQAQRSTGVVGLTLAFSVIVAMFSARGAVRALIDALNRAYRVTENRRGVRKLVLTLALAGGAILGLILVAAVVVALPSVVRMLGLRGYGLVSLLRWPLLMALVFGGLLALYRLAPAPRPPGTELHHWPGALVGTLGIVLVSIGLSTYVEQIAQYDVVYGTFGGVVVVMLWFYLSVIALLVGGFVNAELERHVARSTGRK